MVSYVGAQYGRLGWDDLITTVYAWDNTTFNNTTKTIGNWIIITPLDYPKKQPPFYTMSLIPKMHRSILLQIIIWPVNTFPN